jgi:hypothetical protein
MFPHPYFLDTLVQQHQAEFLAEATNQATVAEALRHHATHTRKRQVRIVRTPTRFSQQARLAIRTDMPA